jgi:hypothetical protein
MVLLEARRNIAEKSGEAELVRFYRQMATLDPEMAPPPPPQRLADYAQLATSKDAHVLAAALECQASYLLTLDRRHLLTPAVQSAQLPLKVLTPGDFLTEVQDQRKA